MYNHNLKQLELPEIALPFQRELSLDSKWVKIAVLLECEESEEYYRKNFFNTDVGHSALSVRMALAALITKEELFASYRACVEQIKGNQYLQKFCGLKVLAMALPFMPLC